MKPNGTVGHVSLLARREKIDSESCFTFALKYELSDVFFVDLETRCKDVKGKAKSIDITCSFPNANVSCAIELKFKTSQQGAQDHGRIDAYVDIEAIELVCESHFTFGRFFLEIRVDN